MRRADSSAVPLPGRDTTAKADTLKSPFARAEVPPLLEIGDELRWDRAALFAAGAVSLLGLLERVPGLTWFRSGWLASPQQAAYLGNAARVRVFLDGLEVAPLDPRTQGLLDLAEVPLWTLEEVAVERGADELRVYLRTWRVERTTASTRTDVATGDVDTNLYRGFFGRRFRNGSGLQLGGEQYGTTSSEFIGGGDQLALMGRVGWASGPWKVDVFAVRARRARDPQVRRDALSQIPGLRAVRMDAYARAAYGDPGSGPWAQVVAGRQSFDEESRQIAGVDQADTSRTQGQYLAAAGFSRWGLRFSATARVYDGDATSRADFSGRASLERRLLSVSLFAERGGDSLTTSEEATLRLTPIPRVALSGSVSRRHAGAAEAGQDREVVTARGEGGIRLWDLWLGGGVIRRDAVVLPPLRVYDPLSVPVAEDRATGAYFFARGRVWRAIHGDVYLLQWDDPGAYRPRTQTRSEAYVRTNWLGRFPSGNFGVLASVAHEYRSGALFPTLLPGSIDEFGFRSATFSHTLSTRLEIRIIDAVIFWQQRLVTQPAAFDYVPGYRPPRRLTLYGIRWQFWN